MIPSNDTKVMYRSEVWTGDRRKCALSDPDPQICLAYAKGAADELESRGNGGVWTALARAEQWGHAGSDWTPCVCEMPDLSDKDYEAAHDSGVWFVKLTEPPVNDCTRTC